MKSEARAQWIMFEPARWLVGTAELDAMTEFVFFRLCVYAYEAGDPIVAGSDRRNALRCKVSPDVYRDAVNLLIELDKIEETEGGLLIKSAARRIEDAEGRIAGRRRGASIARRRGVLKQEGISSAEIDQIIRREFPDDQPDLLTHNITNKTDRTEQTHKGGVGEKSAGLFGNLTEPSKPDLAEAAVAMWNDLAARCDLAKVQKLNDVRRRSLLKRIGEVGGLDGWQAALGKVEESDFLLGGGPQGWKADFDFVLQQKSFTKLMEGSYQKAGRKGSATMAELRGLAGGR